MNTFPHKPFDAQAYVERTKTEPCFICEMVAGRLDGNHIIELTGSYIAFLNKFPVLYGYVLVAPVQHKEQVAGDFTLQEYLALQQAVYRLAEAVRCTVQPERVYLLSLGSQQGNRHVHWHIAPLPPGVPYDQQQLEALSFANGVLDIDEQQMAELARRIRENL